MSFVRPLAWLLAGVVLTVLLAGLGPEGKTGAQPKPLPGKGEPVWIPATPLKRLPGHHETIMEFPTRAAKKHTAWKVHWSVVRDQLTKKENFVIHQAFFKPNITQDWIQVLGLTFLPEIFSAYTDGTRFYDVRGFRFVLSKVSQDDAGLNGRVLGEEKKVIGEVRDRGIHWKVGPTVRRGEDLVLWASLKAGNYDYLIQYSFQDDGVIKLRLGFTGINHGHAPDPDVAHMHSGCWRVDMDLGGSSPNRVFVVRHIEPAGEPGLSKDIVEPFNNGFEGFADWNPLEFTHLRIVNPAVKNANGKPISYDLVPLRTGSARHYNNVLSPNQLRAARKFNNQMQAADVQNEDFTHHDFWVTPYTGPGQELDYDKLPSYVRKGRKLEQDGMDKNGNPVKVEDVVVWYMSSLYHIPRDEDFVGKRPAAALAMWCGFDLRPRNLFSATPFFGLPLDMPPSREGHKDGK
jgi:hypothetical protein